MRFDRPDGCLWVLFVCACCLTARAQSQPPPPQQPDQQKQQQPQQPAPQQPNPFETVPQAAPEKTPAPAQQAPEKQGQKPALETPPPAQPAAPNMGIVEAIEFRGARRVPQDTLKAMIFTKKGDPYDPDTLRRDFMALWNTGRFDDVRLETEPGTAGMIIRFVLVERQVIRSIKYEGMKSVTLSELLDRYKERKVGLSVESQYDPNKIQHAAIVIKEYLAERGRQYAEVTPDLHQIPPSSLEVTFVVNEGAKVKVGKIDIEGNKAFSKRQVIHAMKNLRPLGVPHSILFENLFAKTYDLAKLEEDKSRIQDFYQQRGYFAARVLDQKVTLRNVGAGKFRVPLIYKPKPGIHADITLPIEEGRLFHLRNVNYVGVKLFRVPESLTQPIFRMKQGDVFSTEKLRKGMEGLRDLYGSFGYIDFVPEPMPEIVTGTDQIDLTINADEGKQFYVRRIDFQGNTTTRDKVIRRELQIDEGDLFNSKMWEISVLRLNQLGYFEALKKEDAAQITRNPQSNTVDITLKVKERGKNTIGLTGGVSGIAGSFIGANYSTNNFLGLGETLSIESQLGTRIRNVTLGFTEPYFLDRPIQLGFTVFIQRFSYDQGREASILYGQNLIPLFQQIGTQNLLNYTSDTRGFTVFASYPLRRSFARVGISYGYSTSAYSPLTTAATTYFDYSTFLGTLAGPNQLTGIRTSSITPSYTYNSVDHPITPTHGHSFSASASFAGSYLGGNVNTLQPSLSFSYFHPALKKGHVIGFRVMGTMITGYGGKSAPPFNRYYIGGEQDVRGFEIWGVSPIAFIPSSATVNVLNADGSQRLQKGFDSNGNVAYTNATMTIPVYQAIAIGGDTQAISNFEYRIPIFGPVTLAAFFDAGWDRVTMPSQLKISDSRLAQLQAQFPTAGFTREVKIAAGTQRLRASTGLELQVILPVVNAPFRIYWAYNPSIYNGFVQQPVVVDRSMFPNAASYFNSVATIGSGYNYPDRRTMFRFTVGRTF
jgi:outer membrane protein insertion porin family